MATATLARKRRPASSYRPDTTVTLTPAALAREGSHCVVIRRLGRTINIVPGLSARDADKHAKRHKRTGEPGTTAHVREFHVMAADGSIPSLSTKGAS